MSEKMGNAELKAVFKNALKDSAAKGWSNQKDGIQANILDDEDDMIETMYKYLTGKMLNGTYPDADSLFKETNVQKNENVEETFKRQVVTQLSNDLISGFTPAESLMQALTNNVSEENFAAVSPPQVESFTEIQKKKFVILYALYTERFRESKDQKQSFFDYVKKFMTTQPQGDEASVRAQAGLETGFKFALSLLKEIRDMTRTISKPNGFPEGMLINSLDHLYQTLRQTAPGAFFSTDRLSFMIDANLNDARGFLLSIVEDRESPQKAAILAAKIIVLIAIARSNLEDLLIISNLLEREDLNIDIRQEIELLKTQDSGASTAHTEHQSINFKDRKVSKENILFELHKLGEIGVTDSITTDGENLYMHSDSVGLIKFSSGNANQMAGQIIEINQIQLGTQASILYLNGRLYLRANNGEMKNSKDQKVPYLVIDPKTLKVIEDFDYSTGEEEEEKSSLEQQSETMIDTTAKDSTKYDLFWSNEKTDQNQGRIVCATPLMSNGVHLFTLSVRIVTLKQAHRGEGDHEQEEEVSQKFLYVEQWDVTSKGTFKFIREVKLQKKEGKPYIFGDIDRTIETVPEYSWCTNGQYLFVQNTSSLELIFDLNTGLRVHKYNFDGTDNSGYENKTKVVYDYINNQFLSFKRTSNLEDFKLVYFTNSAFKKVGSTTGFAKEYLSKRLSKFKQQVFLRDSQIVTDGGSDSLINMNVIERLMFNVSTEDLIKESHKLSGFSTSFNADAKSILKALTLGFIEHSCHEFDQKAEEAKSQSSAMMMEFFKFPNATYLTTTVFEALEQHLSRSSDIIKSKKTLHNLPQQYSFYFVLKVLATNFQALNLCKLALPSLLKKEASYNQFLSTYKKTIISLIEEGYSQDFEGEKEDIAEMKALWVEIYHMCLKILSNSMSLIYSDNKEIITNLEQSLSEATTDSKQAENSVILLNYLSTPTNFKKLLTEDSQQQKTVFKVVGICCQIVSNDIIAFIKSEESMKQLNDKEKEALLSACNIFIQGLNEEAITKYCSLIDQQSTSKSKQLPDQERQHLKDIEGFVTMFFEVASSEIQSILKALTSDMIAYLEKDSSKIEDLKASFTKYEENFVDLFNLNSAFYQIISLQVRSFSISKLNYSILATINHQIQSLLEVINNFNLEINVKRRVLLEQITQVKEVTIEDNFDYEEFKGLSPTEQSERISKDKWSQITPELTVKLRYHEHNLTKNVPQRNTGWNCDARHQYGKCFSGLTGFHQSDGIDCWRCSNCDFDVCIKCMQVSLMIEKLCEGQNKVAQQFTELDYSLKNQLDDFSRNLCWFIGQTAYKLIILKEPQTGPTNEVQTASPQDELQEMIMQSNLLSGGIEPRLIQWAFSKETLATLADLATVTKEKLSFQSDGMSEDDKLLNAIINPGQNDHVDRLIGYLQGFLERKIPLVPYARLSGAEGLRLTRAAFGVMIKFSDLFDSFSQLVDEVDMQWMDLEGDDERDFKMKEAIKKAHNYDQIFKRFESASKMRQWINEMKKELIERLKDDVDKGNPSLSEEQKEELTDQKFNVELASTFTKVVEKAELLIRLTVPEALLEKEQSQKKRGSLLFIQEAMAQAMVGSASEETQHHINWKNRMQTWRHMLTSKATIKSFTDKKKEIFDSTVMSILACLQAPLNTTRIKKQVEQTYLSAKKRIAGLKLLAQAMSLEHLPRSHRYDLISWFASGLRNNKSETAHYLDGLKGCGHDLEAQARTNFFGIIKGLIKQLAASTDENDIKIIINALKWNFMAKDHSPLKQLEIFRVLHDGSGQYDGSNLIANAWGKTITLNVCSSEEEKSLSQTVFDMFEELFFAVLRRIVKPEVGVKLKMKNSLSLEKAHSVVDENASESLLMQAFDIVFKEVKNYVDKAFAFPGINWNTFLAMSHGHQATRGWYADVKETQRYGCTYGDTVYHPDIKKLTPFIQQAKPPMMKQFKVYGYPDKDTGYVYGVEVIYRGQEGTGQDSFKVGQHICNPNCSSWQPTGNEVWHTFNFNDGEYITEFRARLGAIADRLEFTTNQGRSWGVGGSGGDLTNLQTNCGSGKHAMIVAVTVGMFGPVHNCQASYIELDNDVGLDAYKSKSGASGEASTDDDDNVEYFDESKKESILASQDQVRQNDYKQLQQLYSETFLKRLLRLIESFTSLATISLQQYLRPIQKVGIIQVLINLLLLANPKVKLVIVRILQNLVKIGVPHDVFEEAIQLADKDDRLTIAHSFIRDDSVDCKGSRFIKFLLSYLFELRSKVWYKNTLESEGTYAVSEEILRLLKFILEGGASAPSQEDMRQSIRNKVVAFLSSPMDTWTVDQADIIMSLLRGGQFSTLMAGSHALYKESQHCVILGFSEQALADNDLRVIETEKLNDFKYSTYCTDPSKQRALILFIAEKEQSFLPEVRAVNVHNLIPVHQKEAQDSTHSKSLLYDAAVLRNIFNVLAVDAVEETPLAVRQAQVQAIKVISEVVESEWQSSGTHSEFLKFLDQEGLLLDLFGFLQRNAGKPQLLSKNELNLPTELLELTISQIRVRTMESQVCLIKNSQTLASFSSADDTLTIFDQASGANTSSFLLVATIMSSINEDTLFPTQKTTAHSITLLNQIKANQRLLNGANFDLLVLLSDELFESTLHPAVVPAIQNSNIIITDDGKSPEEIYLILKRLNRDIPALKRLDPLHHKTVFQINRDAIEKLIMRDTSGLNSKTYADKKEQYSQLLVDLKEWAGYTDEQIKEIQNVDVKSKTPAISVVQKLQEQMTTVASKAQAAPEEQKHNANIKKLFVGKMASLSRKQDSIKGESQQYEDLGQKIWEESFAHYSTSMHDLVNTNLLNLTVEAQSNNVDKEKQSAFATVFKPSTLSQSQLYQKYIETLNKLLRLRSRTALITFLHYLNPLPKSVLNSFESLEKLLLISYNEAVNIKLLTGSKSLLNQVVSFMRRLIKDNSMLEFVNEFLRNHVLKPSTQVIKRILSGDKEFLARAEVFDSEVDASMYPLPSFLYKVTKIILQENPSHFYAETRGLLNNTVSILVAHALSRSVKDNKTANQQIKYLSLASRLLTMVRAGAQSNKEEEAALWTCSQNGHLLEDISESSLMRHIVDEISKHGKINSSKEKEQMRILREVFYEWVEIKKLYQSSTKISEGQRFFINKQMSKFTKKINYLKGGKDPLTLFQLMASSSHKSDTLSALEEFIHSNEMQKYTTEGLPIVPFIMKIVPAERGSETIEIQDFDLRHEKGIDNVKFFVDKECTLELSKELDNRRYTSLGKPHHIYLCYQKSMDNTLLYFGWSKGKRLPNNNSDSDHYDKMKQYHYSDNFTPSKIQSCRSVTMFLNQSNNKLFWCGQIKGLSNNDDIDSNDFGSPVKLFSAGKQTISVVLENNTIKMWGKSKSQHYDEAQSEDSKNWRTVLNAPPVVEYFQQCGDPAESKIVAISTGTHFTLYVTEAGKLYGSGALFFNTLDFTPSHQCMFVKVPGIDYDKLSVKNVWTSRAKNTFFTLIEVEEKETKDKYLMSAGLSFDGLLGNGNIDEVQSNSFKRLDYDYQTVKFKKVCLLTRHVLALTESGELYGWGSNEGQRLGLQSDAANSAKPIRISFFCDQPDRFKILDIAAGDDHSFVSVLEFMNENQAIYRVYQIGFVEGESHCEHRGASAEDLLLGGGIASVKVLDNHKVKTMACGHQTSFFAVGDKVGPLSKSEVQDVLAGVTIEDEKAAKKFTSPIPWTEMNIKNECVQGSVTKSGYLHLFLDDQGTWKFFSQKEYMAMSDHNEFPPVSLAIRHEIPQLYEKLDDLKEILNQAKELYKDTEEQKVSDTFDHNVECSDTGEKIINGPRYYTCYKNNQDVLVEANLCDATFAEPTSYDHHPLIYYRFARPLPEGVKMPEPLDLEKFFSKMSDEDLQISFSVTTHPLHFTNKKMLIDKLQDLENKQDKKTFVSLLKNGSKYEKQVQQFFIENNALAELEKVDEVLWEKKKEILKYIKDKSNADQLNDSEKRLLDALQKIVTEENFSAMQVSFAEMQMFFRIAKTVFTRLSNRSLKGVHPDSLPFLRKKLLSQFPGYIRDEMMQQSISQLPSGDRFEVTIRRRKAFAFQETGNCDHEGTHTIFGQILQEMKKSYDKNIQCFRVNSVDSQVLRVEFKGEGSIDAGGPYRETLTNICKELQSGILPLLIPTPNNKNNHGQNRECWMVNPSSTSPTHLEMFKFLGHFLGMAIRSQQALPLDLAPIFWKLLLDETGDMQTDAENELDLKSFDTYSWQVIDDLRANTKDLSESDFECAIEEYFVTLLSNGQQVELVPGGSSLRVTKANLEEYVKAVVRTRLNEASRQMKALKEGVEFVIPLSLCKMNSWKMIEARATGSKSLDIEKLKSITQYNSCQASEDCIQIFWRVLESFNDEERSLYLKFVWGRARLPATTDQKHQITAMQYNQNSCLPVSHTCFFTLDYPRYPSFEVARDRILFAIRFCGDIDADRSSHSIESDD